MYCGYSNVGIVETQSKSCADIKNTTQCLTLSVHYQLPTHPGVIYVKWFYFEVK